MESIRNPIHVLRDASSVAIFGQFADPWKSNTSPNSHTSYKHHHDSPNSPTPFHVYSPGNYICPRKRHHRRFSIPLLNKELTKVMAPLPPSPRPHPRQNPQPKIPPKRTPRNLSSPKIYIKPRRVRQMGQTQPTTR